MRATAVLLTAAAASASAFTAIPRTIPNAPSARTVEGLSTARRCSETTTLMMGVPRMGHRREGGGRSCRPGRGGGGGASLFRRRPAPAPPGFRSAAAVGIVRAVRRAAAIAAAAAIVAFGGARPPLSARPPHASAAASSAAVRVVSSPSRAGLRLASSSSAASGELDRMIERYVRRRMFSDDAYDPFESAYREAHYDQNGSPYPTIIEETAADILGKKEVAAKVGREGSAFDRAWERLDGFAGTVERKFGISKQLSLSTMFIAIFCTPVVLLFMGAIIFGERQKERSEKAAFDRYGYGLNDLSAAERFGEDIEAPDDEDDEDDEDEDDDDDDDKDEKD